MKMERMETNRGTCSYCLDNCNPEHYLHLDCAEKVNLIDKSERIETEINEIKRQLAEKETEYDQILQKMKEAFNW